MFVAQLQFFPGFGAVQQSHGSLLLHRAEAWEELQLRYEHGLGTPQDFVAAARCFSKLLLSESSYNHSPEDLVELVEFKSPRRSWTAPSTFSPDNHFHIYQPASDQNRLPTDDVLRALSLYLKSARGDGQSAERLGEKYLAGDGVEKSPSKAWAWFSVAALNGSRTDPEKIARLEKQFTGSEAEAGREYLRGLRADLQQVSAVIAK